MSYKSTLCLACKFRKVIGYYNALSTHAVSNDRIIVDYFFRLVLNRPHPFL